MGFSWFGLIFSLIIAVPVFLVWLVFPPKPRFKFIKAHSDQWFIICERVGVGCALLAPVFFPNFILRNFNAWSVWAILAFACEAVFVALIAVYFMQKRNITYLYKKILFIPVPLTVFATAAVLLFAVWGKSVLLIVMATIFGAGQIVISLQERKELKIR